MKPGDTVITKESLWHNGTDVGDRLGKILDTTSYILVEIFSYDNNPVKCFRSDVEVIESLFETPDSELAKELDDVFSNWNP